MEFGIILLCGVACHRILEDPLPLGERQVTGEHHAAALVVLGQQHKEHLHLFPALLHITDVIDDQSLVLR